MIWARWGAWMMFAAILMGAFGAHALKTRLDAYGLEVWRTAVLYHALHALGLFAVAWMSGYTADPKLATAGGLMVAGIFLFSGSLYVLALTGVRALGAVTPFGGLCFLAAWIIVALAKI